MRTGLKSLRPISDARQRKRVFCPSCHLDTTRTKQWEGLAFGVCPNCQTPLQPCPTHEDKRAVKAKQEIAAQEQR